MSAPNLVFVFVLLVDSPLKQYQSVLTVNISEVALLEKTAPDHHCCDAVFLLLARLNTIVFLPPRFDLVFFYS